MELQFLRIQLLCSRIEVFFIALSWNSGVGCVPLHVPPRHMGIGGRVRRVQSDPNNAL